MSEVVSACLCVNFGDFAIVHGVVARRTSPGMPQKPGSESFPLNGSLEAVVSPRALLCAVEGRTKPSAVSAQKATFR